MTVFPRFIGVFRNTWANRLHLAGISPYDNAAGGKSGGRYAGFHSEYALMKGDILNGYIHDTAYQLNLSGMLYFEAMADQVFTYIAEKFTA